MGVQFMLSGGAANNNPAQSIGGVISSNQVAKSQVSPTSLMGGKLVIVDSNGLSGSYTAYINYTSGSAASVYFIDGDGVVYPHVQELSNNTETVYYLDPTGERMLIYYITGVGSASGEFSEAFTATPPANNNLFNAVTPAQIAAGDPLYRCVYVKPMSFTMKNGVVFISQQMQGSDVIEIALDPSGLNGTAYTLADELDSTNMLAGLTFVNAKDYGSALALPTSMVSGSRVPVWLKYTPDSTISSVFTTQNVAMVVGHILW